MYIAPTFDPVDRLATMLDRLFSAGPHSGGAQHKGTKNTNSKDFDAVQHQQKRNQLSPVHITFYSKQSCQPCKVTL